MDTSSSIFNWQSLKTRVTITTLAFFAIGIWSLAIYTSFALKNDMEQMLGEQQYSTVSIIASEINTELSDRMRSLEQVAKHITPAMLGDAASMQTFLEVRPILPMMFNGGVFVLLHDGTAIADSPLSTGRRGINFMDRQYAIGALKEGKTTIGSPVMGKALRSTVFSIATPIHDAEGKVIGALSGTIDLAKPNFISRSTDNSYGRTGGYLLVSPKMRTIVYATDKKRIMELLPPPGVNPLIDRYIGGYEGTGIAIRPNDGVEVLTSARHIPVSGWYVVALMPTEEAFAPVNALQKRGLLAAIFLTLLAGGLTWWMLKRQLAPVFSTIKTLTALSDRDQPPQPLPITRQDEIGEMIASFNKLLETLRQREEALRESEEWHRTILRTAMDGFWRVDLQGHLLEVNETYCRMSGYSKEELLAMSISDLEAAEMYSETAVHMEKVMTRGEDRFETWHHRKDGGIFEVEISVQYKPSKEGQFIVFLRDITERKLADEAIRHAKEDWEQTFDAVTDMISIISTNHTIIRVNRAMADHCCCDPAPEELIGRKCHEVMHSTPEPHAGCPHEMMMQDGFGHTTQVEEKRLGRVFDVTVSPLYNAEGQLTASVHVARDVTERNRRDELLREREQRLSFLLTSTPAVIYTCRPFGDFGATFISDNVQKLLGYQASEFTADSGFWANHIHPEDSERILAGMSALSTQDCHSHEYRFLHKDGTYRWMHDEIQILRDAAGQPTEMIGFWLDISENKKRAEEQLELQAQFQQTQKLESLGVLAGGIAHDFNNILTIILGHCYIIDGDIDPETDQKSRVKEIEKAANRAAGLCRQMLAYGGKNALIQTSINLWLMVNENVNMLTSAIKKSVGFELDLQHAVPEINGDSAQIQQVVMNLIINAAEAIGDKSGVIKIVLKRRIILPEQPETDFIGNPILHGSYACLEVADNGCGMSIETQKRIFEPFFTTKFTGRGLGMSAVLGIIKSHGGALQLASTPGVGTTFKVYFPSNDKPDVVETEQTVEAVPMAKGCGTVLLVDDEESLRIVGSALLEALGFSVLTAANGREALEMYSKQRSGIDLVLMDMLMPLMGGIETYRKLREISPLLPVVICSGCSAEEVEGEIISDKQAAVIQKPYRPEQLRNTLMKLIDHFGVKS